MDFHYGDEDEPAPSCVICHEILTNESMKPSNLKRHFELKHIEYKTNLWNVSRINLKIFFLKTSENNVRPDRNDRRWRKKVF